MLAHRIDEGLVQTDSPFVASKQFGITYTTGRGAVAEVGTLMEIVDHAPIGSGGRMFINNTGATRQSTECCPMPRRMLEPLCHH